MTQRILEHNRKLGKEIPTRQAEKQAQDVARRCERDGLGVTQKNRGGESS